MEDAMRLSHLAKLS